MKMKGRAKRHLHKIMSVALISAILINLLCGMNPISINAENEVNQFTFQIMDTDFNPVAGADISCTSVSGGSITLVSNSEGAAVLDSNIISLGNFHNGIAMYSVSKRGYEEVSFAAVSGAALTIESGSTAVILSRLPVVKVKGRVTSNYMAVSGAAISLSGYENYSTITDENGYYSFEYVYGKNDPAGQTYQLSVSHKDYITYNGSLSVANAEVTEDIVLVEKAEQENFRFYDEYPVSIDIISNNGVIYSNPAIGGSGNGEVTYEIISQTPTKGDPSNQVAVLEAGSGSATVKFLQPGAIMVKAVKAGDDYYKKAEASYHIEFCQGNIPDFNFEKSYYETTATSEFSNQINSKYVAAENIHYSVEGGKEYATVDRSGKLTILAAGDVTVKASTPESTFLREAEAWYTVKIKRARSGNLVFSDPNPDAIYWNDTSFRNEARVENNNSYTISYQSSDTSIASVDGSGLITGYKKGSVYITAKATSPKYEEKEQGYWLTLKRCKRDNFNFTNIPTEITFNDYHKNKLTVNVIEHGSGEISYSTNREDIARFENSNSNILTILKPGTVELYASVKENDQYEAKTIKMELVIHKMDQRITFENPAPLINTYYGQPFTNIASGGGGTGRIVYSITGDGANEIASIGSLTGTIVSKDGKTGEITVKAVKEEDTFYKRAEAEYKLRISFIQTPKEPYRIEGTTVNSSGWYTGNVKIIAKSGYEISYSNSLNQSNRWKTELNYAGDGSKQATVYLKEIATGYITDQILTDTINLDTVAPKQLNITYPGSFIEKVIDFIKHLFGVNSNIRVRLEATDDVSKLASFTYRYTQNGIEVSKTIPLNNDGNATQTKEFEIKGNFRGKVSFYATDIAGNTSAWKNGEMVITDTVAPQVKITLDQPEAIVNQENRELTSVTGNAILVYRDEVKAVIEVEEDNFLEGKQGDNQEIYNHIKINVQKTTLNGRTVNITYKPKDLTWTEDEGIYRAQITLGDEADYIISIDYSDVVEHDMIYEAITEGKSGTKTYVSNVLRVNDTPPQGQVEVSQIISNCDIPVTFKVKDPYFSADNVTVSIEATDFSGNVLSEVDTDILEQYLSQDSSWIRSEERNEENTWIAEVIFTESANYKICFTYTNHAGYSSEERTLHITVDKHAPDTSDFKISYSNSVFEEIINNITFGFYCDDVTVTIEAKDEISAIKSFDYCLYLGKIGEGQPYKNEAIAASYEGNSDTAKATFTIEPEFMGYVTFRAVDEAGNISNYLYDNRIIVVDTIAPELKVTMEPDQAVDANMETVSEYDAETVTRLYFKKDAVVNFIIEEANFYSSDVKISVKNQGVSDFEGLEKPLDWTQITEGADSGKWTASYTLSEEGTYFIAVEYKDRSNNEMIRYESKPIIIDKTPSVISTKLDEDVVTVREGVSYYNNKNKDNEVSVKVEVAEANFRPSDIYAQLTAVTIDGDTIYADTENQEVIEEPDKEANEESNETDGSQNGASDDASVNPGNDEAEEEKNKEIEDEINRYLHDRKNWVSKDGIHTIVLHFTWDANYTLGFHCMDLARNETLNPEVTHFTFDKSKPELKVDYELSVVDVMIENITFGFYKASAKMKLTATDKISGIESLYYLLQPEAMSTEGSLEDPAEQKPVEIPEEDIQFKNGNRGKAEYLLSLEEDFRGYVIFAAEDVVENYEETNKDKVVVVDNISPNATISYNPPKCKVNKDNSTQTNLTADTILLYPGDIHAVIEIDETNFFEGNMDGEGNYINDVKVSVKKEDLNGIITNMNYIPYDSELPGQMKLNWVHNGNKHKAEIVLSGDGDYVITVQYTDKSGNQQNYQSAGENKEGTHIYTSNTLRIDSTRPIVDISPAKSMSNENILVTFTVTEHNFHPSDLSVSISAMDIDGKQLSSVNTNKYSDQLSDIRNWNKVSTDVWRAVITFDQDANYSISAVHTDKAGNASNRENAGFTVDKTPPRQDSIHVSYSNSIIDMIINAVTFGFYQKPVTVTISAEDPISGISSFDYRYLVKEGVSEINKGSTNITTVHIDNVSNTNKRSASTSFQIPPEFVGNVSCSAKDNAGNVSEIYTDSKVLVVDSISPIRTVQLNPVHIVDKTTLQTMDTYAENSNTKLFFAGDAQLQCTINEANFYKEDVRITVSKDAGSFITVTPDSWASNKDEHTFVLTLSGEGDYIVRVDYTDRSQNAMVSYISDTIVIDTTKPEITAEITKEPQNSLDGIDYYNSAQSLTVKVKEHNFRPQDITAFITAKSVDGRNIDTEDYNAYLRNIDNWIKEGDLYTAVLSCSEDANYSFDITYKDLALNESEDYPVKCFTIDSGRPGEIDIQYSSSVLDTVIEAVTFGFYNSQTTVEISAEDNISGIDYFIYSYMKEPGALGASAVDQKIVRSNITYSEGGSQAKARFTVPRASMGPDGQFRGNISFQAYDCSGNVKELKDNKIIIVDSIAPNLEVSYSTPVQNKNGTLYYSDDVQVSFHLQEENFFEEDVKLEITKDGRAFDGIHPSWTRNGGEWLGTFTLSAGDPDMEGQYYLKVDYQDKSNNSIHTYTSERIIIDSTKPVIQLSGIQNESANKGDKIGFEIDVEDTNLNRFDPAVTVTYMDENKKVVEKKVNVGKVITQEEGKHLRYQIDNLTLDGVYKVTCSAEDLAGNNNNEILITGKNAGANQYSEPLTTVIFSVNRNGSTFLLGENTQSIVDSYYVKDVTEEVEISEINVDPLKSSEIILNDVTLSRDTDYTVKEISGQNGWYQYSYYLSNRLFSKEGQYNVVIKSIDKAGTVSYSDIKKAEISFIVDKTKPEITVSGMQSNGAYRTDVKSVSVIPRDPGGLLQTLEVTLNHSEKLLELNQDDLDKVLESNSSNILFDIPSGMGHTIQITCQDKAGNQNRMEYDNITVSTDWYILFYANKPLFWGSIAGVSFLLLSGITMTLVIKRKRNINRKVLMQQ